MRVLFVIPALDAVYGGPSKVATACATAVTERGATVEMATTSAGMSRKPESSRADSWASERAGFRLRYFRRFGRTEYKLSLSLLVWLCRQVKNYEAVLVISDFNFPTLAAALACRLNGVPYIVAPHGMLEPWALQHKGWKKRVYFRLIEKPLVLSGAVAIQALNGSEAENIGKLKLAPPIFILPNGVDRPDADAAVDSGSEAFLSRFPQTCGKTLLLFLHRIDPKKGLDLLATAFALVRARFPEAHLVIAGPDNAGFGATARGYFDAAGISADAVTFTGMLEGPVKRGAFAAASVFVLPSYSEGFSLAVLEAMAAGLPCVITSACNFPEAGKAEVAKVVAAEPSAFAEALNELLAAPDEAKEMGLRARMLVLQNYTWDSVAERLMTFLEKAVVAHRNA